MLTLGAFMCLIWVSCIYALAHRYQVRPVWVTTVSIIVALLASVVVGATEEYEPLWYVVSLNVVLLGSILFVYCLGNAEKQEWTETVQRNMTNIFVSLEQNKHALSELSKRIK